MGLRISGLIIGVALAAACGAAPAIVFPAGAPVPSPEAAAAWRETTAACRSAATYSAELKIDGRVGTEKLRHVTLQGAMTRDGRIRLIAVAPVGAPIFVLAGRADRATLTLPRDRRVLVAPVADIVDALIGLRFAPADWVDVLTGCVAADAGATGGTIGADIVMNLGAGRRALLRKDGAAWRVAAGERPESTIEYRQYDGRWPSLARIATSSGAPTPGGAGVAIDVNLAIAQIFVNVDLKDQAFAADVPADFSPMTLAELRAIGPLGEREPNAGADAPAYVRVP